MAQAVGQPRDITTEKPRLYQPIDCDELIHVWKEAIEQYEMVIKNSADRRERLGRLYPLASHGAASAAALKLAVTGG